MNCSTCLELMYPHDPRVSRFMGLGRYGRPSCDYCSSGDAETPPTSFEPPLPCNECPSHKKYLDLRGQFIHLEHKFNEHFDIKKRPNYNVINTSAQPNNSSQ